MGTDDYHECGTRPVREVPVELTREQAQRILEDKIRRYRELAGQAVDQQKKTA